MERLDELEGLEHLEGWRNELVWVYGGESIQLPTRSVL
jgi:hypothetical protein